MDDMILTALRGSIKKWEQIVAGTGIDAGASNCPLCELYLNDKCDGCPVSVASGYLFCRNTPYSDEWLNISIGHIKTPLNNVPDRNPEKQRALQAAKNELAFLQSLLPKEH